MAYSKPYSKTFLTRLHSNLKVPYNNALHSQSGSPDTFLQGAWCLLIGDYKCCRRKSVGSETYNYQLPIFILLLPIMYDEQDLMTLDIVPIAVCM